MKASECFLESCKLAVFKVSFLHNTTVVEYLQDCNWEFVLCKQISVSDSVRRLLICNFISLGLSRAEFVHGGSVSNPVFSPRIAEQVGMRIGVQFHSVVAFLYFLYLVHVYIFLQLQKL